MDTLPTDSTEGAPIVVCPVEKTLDIIGGKWKPLIIYHLLQSPKRFSELQRAMPMVTRRMLTEHLRDLEADGMVHREVFKQVPPKVVYSLTPLGLTLKPLLDQILAWGVFYAQETGAKLAPVPNIGK
jgi:DNA-binding HxlR family transcriptional regulator